MTSTPARTAEAAPRSAVRRVALASGIGNAIELYDFIIYGLASAIVFNQVFFVTEDPLVGTLIAFLTMGAGFLSRPLGGLVFGHFGDRLGRKSMLVTTLTATGVCTFLIGLVPATAEIGLAAPFIVLALRLLQGFFMGGEQGGAFVMVTEHAPAGTKSFYGGWATGGSPLGSILGTLSFTLAASATGDAFLDWGWRLPFFASAVLVLVGLYIRLRLDESPEFTALERTDSTAAAPLVEVVGTAGMFVLAGILLNMGFNLTIFIINTFSMAFGTEALGMERSTILTAGLIGSAVHLVTCLTAAYLGDRLGMTRVMGIVTVLLIAWAFPFFWFFSSATATGATIAIVGGYAFAGIVWGPMAYWFTALFAPRFRYSGVSVSFQVGAVLGGGLSPSVSTWLLQISDGATWPISVYLVIGGLLALIGLTMGRTRIAQMQRPAVGQAAGQPPALQSSAQQPSAHRPSAQ